MEPETPGHDIDLSIEPTLREDLPELSQFLTEGFGAPADASFAAPDVLLWKYFDPRGSGDEPRSYVGRAEGRIVGHVGVCAGAFVGDALPGGAISTLHGIDWLAARRGRRGSGVGRQLMELTNRLTATQYALGASKVGRRTLDSKGGYRQVENVPAFQKVIRPSYRLRAFRERPVHALGGWVRDLVRAASSRGRSAKIPIELRSVEAFGGEIDPIVRGYQAHAVFFDRRPALLSYFLRHPRRIISGALLRSGGAVRGYGVLSVVDRGGVRVGKLADCIVDSQDPDLWHAAIHALTNRLRELGADLVEVLASTVWMRQAAKDCGFRPAYELDLRIRDPGQVISPKSPMHITWLEGDYSYI